MFVRSDSYSEVERFTKERIYRDIYELECSWNDFQYQKQREVLVGERPPEHSFSRYTRTQDRSTSPDVSLQKRTLQTTNNNEKKAPHRTKISLVSGSKKNLYVNFEREAIKQLSSHKGSVKRLPKNAAAAAPVASPVPQKKTSEYIQKVFNNCLASKHLETTPKLRTKPTRQQTVTTIRRSKQLTKICSPSPRHKLSQDSTIQEPPSTMSINSRTTEPKNFFGLRQAVENSGVARATVKLNSSHMQIETILLQQIESRAR